MLRAPKGCFFCQSTDIHRRGRQTFKVGRFIRGWTLQKLIMLPSMIFFSSEYKWLGDKNSLEHHVSAVTGIPVRDLRGDTLSSFSTIERMS